MSQLEHFKSFVPQDNKVRVKGTNAVIYTRVSHASQEDNTSLESQLKYCENFAQKKGLQVVGYFGGTYESAKTDERKEFNRMLKFIKQSRNVSYVVVYSYERFSRSGVGGAKIADDLLKNNGIVTLAVTQELDPTTSSGSFQQKILFLFGQMDNEMRRDKTVTGMSELLRKGYTPYSIPRGYRNLNRGKAVDQKIVVNEEGELIKMAFNWKVKHDMCNSEIVSKLNSMGMEIDQRRLGEIFGNPYYCGIIVSKMIPGEIIEGKHEPIVSRELFLQANKVITDKRHHPLIYKESDDNMPLKRFVRCSACSAPMTGFLVKRKGLYYYKCRTEGCRHTISAEKLHGEFAEVLSGFQIEKCDIPLVEGAMLEYYDLYFEEQLKNIQLTKKRLTELKQNLQAVKEQFALGKIEAALFSEFAEKYKTEISEIEENAKITQEGSSNLKKCLKHVLKFCLKPLSLWASKDSRSKSAIQKFIFPDGISLCKQTKRLQTTSINPLFAPIAELVRLLTENKKGQLIFHDQLSFRVTSEGVKPSTS